MLRRARLKGRAAPIWGAAGLPIGGRVAPGKFGWSLAEGSVRPDLVVVGHSHREMVDSVRGGVHFVQPKPFGQSLAVVHILLSRRSGSWRVTSVRAGRVLLD